MIYPPFLIYFRLSAPSSQFAPRMFVRLTGRTRHLQAVTTDAADNFLTITARLSGFLITGSRFGGWSASCRYRQNSQQIRQLIAHQANDAAIADPVSGSDALTVYFDMSTLHRGSGKTASLEKTHLPQPLVDSFR